ncbi:hypothetical protein IAU59_006872 [Kwoniella sp. CBS 9459]
MPPKKRLTSDWSWAGTTVRNPEDITVHHRRLAAGVVPYPDYAPCAREYDLHPSRTRSRSSSNATSSDVVEIDKNGRVKQPKIKFKVKVAGCTSKGCKGNPWCYNHLGADQVSLE